MPSSKVNDELASWLAARLTQTGANRINVADWGWFNAVWKGGPFRRAHLERLVTPKTDIIHCVVFPRRDDPAPVFGFDTITLSGKNTGLFVDMTPMTTAPYRWWPMPEMEGEHRPLPDWAEFFSDDVIAVRPTDMDVWSGAAQIRQYLRKLGAYVPEAQEKIEAAQQDYTENQRQNPKTRKMLASILDSDDKAREFIHTVLWPDVKETSHE